MMKLYTRNYGGNLHETSNVINKQGIADYVVVMQSSGHSTQVVFKMPDHLVWHLRERDRSFALDPHFDDPVSSMQP